MTYGLAVYNPSGGLVLSSEGIGYKYLGTATQATAASKTSFDYYGEPYGIVTPYTFTMTIPSGTTYPLVGVQVTTTTLVEVVNVVVSGTTLTIYVNSINISGAKDITTVAFTAPTVYVFCPYIDADGTYGYGLNLYNAASPSILTFSSNKCPMLINQNIDYIAGAPYTSYVTGYSQTWSDGGALYTGQSNAWTTLTTGIILGCTGNGEVVAMSEAGDDLYSMSYGWKYSGTTLTRAPYISNKSYRTMDIYVDSAQINLFKQKVLVIDGSNLYL